MHIKTRGQLGSIDLHYIPLGFYVDERVVSDTVYAGLLTITVDVSCWTLSAVFMGNARVDRNTRCSENYFNTRNNGQRLFLCLKTGRNNEAQAGHSDGMLGWYMAMEVGFTEDTLVDYRKGNWSK